MYGCSWATVVKLLSERKTKNDRDGRHVMSNGWGIIKEGTLHRINYMASQATSSKRTCVPTKESV